MKTCGLLLSILLITCGLVPAATCTKEVDPGIKGLLPWSFLYIRPDTIITVRTKGHTSEYVFTQDHTVELYIDGSPENAISNHDSYDTASPQDIINSLCGPGFTPYEGPFAIHPHAAVQTQATSTPAPAGQTTEDSVVADFNKDGVPDSAVLYGAGIFVTLFGPNGTKLSTARYPVANISAAQNIVTADFNRDGVPDLAVTTGVSQTFANPYPSGNVVVLLGNRDGTFGAPMAFAAGSITGSYLAAGDFNGDGVADLALAHSISATAGEVAVFVGKGDGSFAAPVGYPVGRLPFTVIAADFNGDGKTDLAELDASSGPNQVWVLLGRGDGTFLPGVSSPSLSAEGHLAYADLNHDGKLDLVIADRFSSAMEIMMGNGDGTFRPGRQYLLGEQPVSVSPIPLGDGTTALLTPDNGYEGGLFLYFAGSDGTIYSPPLQQIGARPTAIAAADLNGDGNADLVIADSDTGAIEVKLGTGKGGFAAPVSYAAGSQPGPLAVADINGDGRPDVIAADYGGIDILLGNGDGTLGTVNTALTATRLTSLSVADFNGDGKPDVAAAAEPAELRCLPAMETERFRMRRLSL